MRRELLVVVAEGDDAALARLTREADRGLRGEEGALAVEATLGRLGDGTIGQHSKG